MSLKPTSNYAVPAQTAAVAKAAFPKGTLCLAIYDELGTIFKDQDFAEVFPSGGQPAQAPFRLALVTILQYVEGLSDRQAADAVRSRIDWKYLLGLELEDAGFNFSVLSEFRDRLLAGGLEQRLLTQLLEVIKAHGLAKGRVATRTDSTHVLAAVREMNRLERVIETLRATLNALATVDPDWVVHNIPPEWLKRYEPRAENYRLPESKSQRLAYAEQVGCDGNQLLDQLYGASSPSWLCQLPAVDCLRQVWIQNYIPIDATGARWREGKDLPPGALNISSPYDDEARFSKKRETAWLGYKVHLSEVCEDQQPHLITQVHTTPATVPDCMALADIHHALQQVELVPDTHYVDSGYTGAKQLMDARQDYQIEVFGPVPTNQRWQSAQGKGFDLSHFKVDWQSQQVTCPMGKLSNRLRPMIDHRGHEVFTASFKRNDCAPCAHRTQCTKAASRQRSVTIKARPFFEVIEHARARQKTEAFKEQYKKRAGVEGTISQAVRAFGIRQARYRGLRKTALQHIATAAAINLVRLTAWFKGELFSQRISPFAKAMAFVGA